MSTGKAATLDGSLLARKGDAAPAISNHSPLLEELGEPRSDQPGGPYGTGPTSGGAGGTVPGRAMAWSARHPIYGVLGFAVGIAILFAVTIIALSPPREAGSPPISPDPKLSVPEPEKLAIPTDAASMAKPAGKPAESDASAAATAAKPDLPVAEEPVTLAPVESPAPAQSKPTPPPAPVAKSVPKPPVTAKSAAPAKPAIAAPPPSNTGRYLLQLSAVPTAKAARTELVRLSKRLGGVLGNRKIIVVKAIPRGKPPIYRLRASSYDTRSSARAACRQIRKRKMACIVIRR